MRFLDDSFTAALERANDGQLQALFDTPWPRLPMLVDSLKSSPAAVTARLRVPPDLHALRGHFAGIPIVPGAVQVGWAIHFADRLLGISADFAGLDATKFRRIVQPGRVLELQLEWRPERNELRFEYRSAEARFSVGRILLGRRDA